MSRGITEHDVCKAADELLMQGLRPTIERVRMTIGRGSPNTVSPHLEGWFRRLGQRLQEPPSAGAQVAPADVPDPVSQAAAQLWQTALAQARQEAAMLARQARDEAAESARQARADADAAIAAARQEIDTALALARHAAQERDIMARQFEQSQELVTSLQQDLAARTARLEDAGAAIAAVGARLQRQEAREAEALADLRQQLAAALARADAADRRVALELDRERTLRTRAERRVEQTETQLERDRQAAAQRLDDAHRQAQLQLQALAHAAGLREDRLVAQLEAAMAEQAVLRRQVDDGRQASEQAATAAAVAQAEATAIRAAFASLAAATATASTTTTTTAVDVTATAPDQPIAAPDTRRKARRGPGRLPPGEPGSVS
jgi:hypothetical protein